MSVDASLRPRSRELLWIRVPAPVGKHLHLTDGHKRHAVGLHDGHGVDDEQRLGEDDALRNPDHGGGDDRLGAARIVGDAAKPFLGRLERLVDRPNPCAAVHPQAKVEETRRALRQAALALERLPAAGARRRRTTPPRTGCRARSRTGTARSSG